VAQFDVLSQNLPPGTEEHHGDSSDLGRKNERRKEECEGKNEQDRIEEG
jgi:hypothetical protein